MSDAESGAPPGPEAIDAAAHVALDTPAHDTSAPAAPKES